MPAQEGWSASPATHMKRVALRLRLRSALASMTDKADSGFDAIFVGGGVIGLASAWQAAQRGARVCVLERDRPAEGASAVAAGMLAPVGETSWGEDELLAFNVESLRRWPAFAAALEEQGGVEVEFEVRGALHVALDHDEAEEL